MNKEFGYVRVAAVVPELKVANAIYNTEEIISEVKKLAKDGVQIALFPELSLTGYSCGDLFLQDVLIEKVVECLKKIVLETSNLNIISIVGAPILYGNRLYNCGVVINKGKILGIVPKSYIPSEENKYFNSGLELIGKTIKLFDEEVLIGRDLIFGDKLNKKISFGIELGEDLEYSNAPSNELVLNGATMIFNLAASNELVGRYEYRKNLIKVQSTKNVCVYIYASSGVNESSTDFVYSGYAGIFEKGKCLKENDRFNFATNHIIQDVDNQRIINNRLGEASFAKNNNNYRVVDILLNGNDDLVRNYEIYPFVPVDVNKREERCREIINIQASALAKRLKHINVKKCVVGISGGLDSTLAFLVIIEAYRKLGISNDNLIGVTMPGFGTTGRTYNNALTLMKKYGVTIREVSIKEASIQHFKDIGLDLEDRSVTYENTQARERTQILMDIANMEGGIVIGTGDLSELVLGWCTYNGDHMSMYSVNASIPKTLVRTLVQYFADVSDNLECKNTILDILDTPISPELLPPDKHDNIKQQTESVVGPYVLHDFFLYHFMRYGASPKKIKYIALKTFNGMYDEATIDRWLKFFIRRFFNQQFKRSCLPDGPKVGTIAVSPRGDLRMPTDADSSVWLEL